MNAPDAPAVVVAGLPGSLHVDVATAVAERWGVAVCDTDAEVQHRLGCPLAEAFVTLGEEHVRQVERRVVDDALAAGGVVALGSGAADHEAGRAALAVVWVAFCDVSAKPAMSRVGMGMSVTALVNPRATWLRLAEQRRVRYTALAECVVNTDDGIDDAVEAIAVAATRRGEAPR